MDAGELRKSLEVIRSWRATVLGGGPMGRGLHSAEEDDDAEVMRGRVKVGRCRLNR
jgi:hypothetical protein